MPMPEPLSAFSLEAFSNATATLVESAGSAVVSVHSGRSRASGFVWRPGRIVTADDVLADEDDINVTLSGGDIVPATIAGRDPTTDVALLRIDRADLQPTAISHEAVAVASLAIVV